MENQLSGLEHKQEIVETRVGCVGSSDAKMLMAIDMLGYVPTSAYHRLAVVKGIAPACDNVHSAAVEFGNVIEAEIFRFVSAGDSRYVSNPLWVSDRYSRRNVKCIAHPDIVIFDEQEHVINVYEVKTSKHTTTELKREYRAQIFQQCLIAKEIASKKGKQWKVRMHLVHYNTKGLDLSVHNEFDINRLSISRVVCQSGTFNLNHAMDIINAFLDDFKGEETKEVIDAQYLPVEVMQQFTKIANTLREIKAREEMVEAFKAKLYDFLSQQNIVKVKCDEFSFTLVPPSESASFDAKKWFDNFAKNLSEDEVNEIRRQYTVKKQRKGYVLIKVSTNEK